MDPKTIKWNLDDAANGCCSCFFWCVSYVSHRICHQEVWQPYPHIAWSFKNMTLEWDAINSGLPWYLSVCTLQALCTLHRMSGDQMRSESYHSPGIQHQLIGMPIFPSYLFLIVFEFSMPMILSMLFSSTLSVSEKWFIFCSHNSLKVINSKNHLRLFACFSLVCCFELGGFRRTEDRGRRLRLRDGPALSEVPGRSDAGSCRGAESRGVLFWFDLFLVKNV